MNSVVPTDGHLPATDDGFGNVREGGASEYIRGTIITFVDKEFRDRGGTRYNDREFAVMGVRKAWRRFGVDHFIYVPPKLNGYLCSRNELGDTNEKEWAIKFGERQDPWQNMRALFLFDMATAKPFTLITTSSGGRHAIEALSDQINLKRYLTPGVSPIVKLGWAPWGRQFPKSRPDFEVVEWMQLGGPPEPQRQVIGNPLGGEPFDHEAEEARASKQHQARRDDMDDQIPF